MEEGAPLRDFDWFSLCVYVCGSSVVSTGDVGTSGMLMALGLGPVTTVRYERLHFSQ